MIDKMEVRKQVSFYGPEAEYFISEALEMIDYVLEIKGEISLLKIRNFLLIQSDVRTSSQYIGCFYRKGHLTKPPVSVRMEGDEYVFEFNMSDLIDIYS